MSSSIKKAILVDTDFLFAYFVGTDALHDSAVKLFESYRDLDWYMLVPTFAEFLTTLSNKSSKRDANLAFFAIKELGISLLDTERSFWDKAFDLFLEQNKKHTSVIDCLNLVYFRESTIPFYKIASFDKFYGDLRLPGVDSKR